MKARESRLRVLFLALAVWGLVVGLYLERHAPGDAAGWLILLGATIGGAAVVVGAALGLARLAVLSGGRRG